MGILFSAALQFRDLLADCPDFQAWVGADDAIEALDYIHLYRTDEASDIAQTKCAIIDNDTNLQLTRRSSGTGLCAFTRTSGIRFSLMQDLTLNATNAAAFISTVDGIIDDLLDLSGTADQTFKIDSFVQVEPIGLQKHEDPFRWDTGERRGYHLHFSVERRTG